MRWLPSLRRPRLPLRLLTRCRNIGVSETSANTGTVSIVQTLVWELRACRREGCSQVKQRINMGADQFPVERRLPELLETTVHGAVQRFFSVRISSLCPN